MGDRKRGHGHDDEDEKHEGKHDEKDERPRCHKHPEHPRDACPRPHDEHPQPPPPVSLPPPEPPDRPIPPIPDRPVPEPPKDLPPQRTLCPLTGYIQFDGCEPGVFISAQDARSLPPHELVALFPGVDNPNPGLLQRARPWAEVKR